jgi:hypothetical protein
VDPSWNNEIPSYEPSRRHDRSIPLPDGAYQAEILSAFFEEVGVEKKPVIRWELRVLNSQTSFTYTSWLTSEKNRNFVAQELSTAGIDIRGLPGGWIDIPQALKGATGTILNIKVITRNGYQNVRFLERVSRQNPQSTTPQGGTALGTQSEPDLSHF